MSGTDLPACGAVKVPEHHTHICRVTGHHAAALLPHRCDCGISWELTKEELPEGTWVEPHEPPRPEEQT